MAKNLNIFSLEGRIAVVTGAARGIGEAICRQLGEMGAHVVMADLLDLVDETASKLADEGLSTEGERIDVTSSQSVQDLADRVNAKHGRVDIVVANAGVAYESSTEDHSDEDWRRVMAINLDGVFFVARAFGSIMLDQGKGSIVAISSIAGVKAVRPELHIGYDVTKAGVAHFCKVAGVEWATRGVRVNAVGPGYTNTEMLQKVGLEQPAVMARWIDDIPMSRLLEPAEIAQAVAFLASDAASGITGQLLMADAGYSAA
ncbi:SDR family NAD(P)-dependent oxidoreductase [Ruegeria atlantica]|uniref:SDR family NAD(P)-dependent oxidoreductase n=1 Tax=Ruegeria atlantica TaxID=81569 RepID=UPI001480D186|nr:SDR family oxidoreductase [Ruegeria atlantica]